MCICPFVVDVLVSIFMHRNAMDPHRHGQRDGGERDGVEGTALNFDFDGLPNLSRIQQSAHVQRASEAF